MREGGIWLTCRHGGTVSERATGWYCSCWHCPSAVMIASSKNLVRMTILPSLRLPLLSTLVLLALLLAYSMRSVQPQVCCQRLLTEQLLRRYRRVSGGSISWRGQEPGT